MFTAAISLFVSDATSSKAMACSHIRQSAIIAVPLGHGRIVADMYERPIILTPPHRKLVITSPLIGGFIQIGPPHPEIVVVEKPRVRHIVVNLNLNKLKSKPQRVIEQTKITVWIRNSNGSRTSVTLTKSGPGYLGPRGEWYPNMPTEKQLRMVYGF
jgi:hypothetical protein